MITSTDADAPACDTPSSCPGCPGTQAAGGLDRVVARFLGGDRLPTLYLSGPMTAHEDLNYPAFNEAARQLRLFGFPVLNPADFGEVDDLTYEQILARDCHLLSHADVLVLLDGWDKSNGVTVELDFAMGLKIPAVTLDCMVPKVIERFYDPIEVIAIKRLDDLRETLAVDIADETITFHVQDPDAAREDR